ncbi:MAG: Hepatitis C virus core protein [Cyanobacteriota bacterium]|nr:Hepatitis C virus core protein [Cyanobacteriota bacterium]
MITSDPTTLLDPPFGYRPMAWLGLVVNSLVLPLALVLIRLDPAWRTANIAVAAGAVLPTAATGLVACLALLRWRAWGQILAIVALSLSLAVGLPYGIVRLSLVAEGRPLLAVVAPALWSLNVGALVYWCRPAHRRYLI